MKATNIITAMFLLVGTFVWGSEKQEIKSKINDVTVYLQGAQVSRKGYVKLKPGINEIIFRDIANGINSNSIQAGGKGDFIIMDVKYFTEYETQEKTESSDNRDVVKIKRRIGVISDSLDWVNFRLKGYAFKREALLGEKNMILVNNLIKGQVDSFPLLKDLTGFYRERIMDINQQLLEVEKKEFYDSKIKNRMQKETNELNRLASVQPAAPATVRVNKIKVTVSAENYVNGNISIKYLVASAGWSPLYDLRVSKGDEPVKLVYKANLFQNSGENWDEVKLTLATTNPNQMVNKPNLFTFFVDFYQAYVKRAGNTYNKVSVTNSRPEIYSENLRMDNSSDAISIADVDMKEEESIQPAATYANSMTQVVQNMLHLEYKINLPYDIPSDGQYHMVYVQRKDLKSEFMHYAVPKANSTTYLLARVSGFKDLQLIPGNSNIFFDGTYLGQTPINPDQFKDTLDLSLGIDRQIALKRKTLKSEQKDMLTANKSINTFSFEINLKNNKNKNVKMQVLDQIPVSRQKEIEVNLLEAEEAVFNKKTGILDWEINLKPNEERTLLVKFSVKYPKDKQLSPII